MLRALGRAGAARVRVRAEGLAADHAPPAAVGRVEGDGRLPLRRRVGARAQARPGALPAAALPEEGRAAAARLPRPAARRIGPCAFEFRHETWCDDEVYETLRARNAALVCADTEESARRRPIVPTADWGYLRLRRCDYDDAALRPWVERIRAQPWQRAFVFFKHEDGKPLAWPAIERFHASGGPGRRPGLERASIRGVPETGSSSRVRAEPQPPLVESIAAGIAHEVRNPLNALQINLGILEQELSEIVPDRDRPRLRGDRRRSPASCAASTTSSRSSCASPGRHASSLETVAVRSLLADLTTFIGPECTRKGVSLSLAVEGGPETVVADGFQLKHAVLNLVLNALQATPDGGAIVIESRGRRRGARDRGARHRRGHGRRGPAPRVRRVLHDARGRDRAGAPDRAPHRGGSRGDAWPCAAAKARAPSPPSRCRSVARPR